MGHVMMTVGLGQEQHFWCNLCSAYAGERVQKLAKVCDRTTRNVSAVNFLRNSKHPKHGTALHVMARRMLKADVGERLDCLLVQSQGVEVSPQPEVVSTVLGSAVREAIEQPFPRLTDDDATLI